MSDAKQNNLIALKNLLVEMRDNETLKDENEHLFFKLVEFLELVDKHLGIDD